MKKVSVGLLVLAMMLGWGISIACAAPYVSGNLGLVWVEDSDFKTDFGDRAEISFDTGFGITGAIGNAFDNGFRAEGELGYRTNDMDEFSAPGFGSESIDGDISALSLMANGYYDFMPGNTVSPFVGFGIGFANVEADIDFAGSEDDNVLAYQLAAGVAFPVNPNMNVDLQYRLFGTEDPDFDDVEAEYTTHNLMVGLRYSF
jgi:opacity protein-like surface antigen